MGGTVVILKVVRYYRTPAGQWKKEFHTYCAQYYRVQSYGGTVPAWPIRTH